MPPLDNAFLATVLAGPGVYLMLGADGELLYVGKARNLRARLRSYARLRPGRDRRLDPLLAAVVEVRWQPCPTEAEALRRETELIRALRPPFNTVHAQLSEHLAIAIREHGARCRIRLAGEPAPDPERMWFYPFAAAAPVGMAALTRLLFMAQLGSARRDPPADVTRSSGCEVGIAQDLRPQLFSFLDGRSPRLVHSLEAALREVGGADPVRSRSIARDLDRLRTFYRAGPRAVRRLQLVHGGGGPASAAELSRLLAAEHEREIGSRVVARLSGTAEEQIVVMRRGGLNVVQIAERLNHSGPPRAGGGGRWRHADVIEVLARAEADGVPTHRRRSPWLRRPGRPAGGGR